jgi:hypothetical protein
MMAFHFFFLFLAFEFCFPFLFFFFFFFWLLLLLSLLEVVKVRLVDLLVSNYGRPLIACLDYILKGYSCLGK